MILSAEPWRSSSHSLSPYLSLSCVLPRHFRGVSNLSVANHNNSQENMLTIELKVAWRGLRLRLVLISEVTTLRCDVLLEDRKSVV